MGPEYAPQRHLHVPSQPAAPVELAHADAADFRLQCRIHNSDISIAGATTPGVSLHMVSGLTPYPGDLFSLNGLRRGGWPKKGILINVMGLGFFIISRKVPP